MLLSTKYEGYPSIRLGGDSEHTHRHTHRVVTGNNNIDENIDRFIKELIPILIKMNRICNEIALLGDFNIDLLKLDDRLKFQAWIDELTNLSLFPKITLPTRIGRQSSTLIDNIFCKLTPKTICTQSGIIYSDVSDHFPCFGSFDLNKKTKPAPKLVKQKFSTPNAIENFKNGLANHDFIQDIDQSHDCDPNSNYEIFISKVIEIKDKHIPTKLVKFDKHKHKKESWITFGIIKSISFRDNLRLRLIKTNIHSPEYEDIKQNLRTYNSIIKNSIRLAKTKYYTEIFDKYKSDMKNTWKHISSLLTKSNRKDITQINVKCKVNGDDIDIKIKDKLAIANEFNNFFANIGPKLATSIKTDGIKNFDSYLRSPIQSTFKFKPYTENDTLKLIQSLKSKTSTGHDGISVRLLKIIAPGIAHPITIILNQTLKTGIFPNNLKIAKIIPLHKKESTELVDNYRPVSLLNAISKVFERAAYNQLYNYFKTNSLFYNNQYGFRDEHSTELASSELIDRIFNDLDNKLNPMAIYVNLSKAFYTLDHSILIKNAVLRK